MRPIALVFEAADGRPLAATVLEPRRITGAVVIASATGVPRRIYDGVAGCLADAGFAVLTFDYRGIGGSMEGRSVRTEDVRMQDWGRLDLEGALCWMRRAYAGAPLLVLGHSAGGQLIGLAPSSGHLSGAALIGSQLGWTGSGETWPASGWRRWSPSTAAAARSTPSPPPRPAAPASATSAGSARASRERSGRRSATGSSSGSSPRRFGASAEPPRSGAALRRHVSALAPLS